MQHKEPAWALFFTWEIEMSFRAAAKAIEQLPRFVVMISGFHSLEQIPLKLPLWFVNQQLPYFLRDIITTNRSVESPGRSEGSGLYFQGLFIFWAVYRSPALFLGIGKKHLGICLTNQPPVFSIYTSPFLTTWQEEEEEFKTEETTLWQPYSTAQHFQL